MNFGKKYNSEFGKVRPAVVMQNSFLNMAIDESIYKSVLVIPLSSTDLGGDYRLKIKARDKLEVDSECVANWICTLDIERFQLDKGVITTLTDDEFDALQEKVCSLM